MVLDSIKFGAIGAGAGILLGFWSGWSLGTGHIQSKWDRAENEARDLQVKLYDQAIDALIKSQQVVAARESELAGERELSQRREDELREQIQQSETVRTIVREVPANCPVVECYVPDLHERVRLFNAGISNTSATIPVATPADSGDGEVPGADDTP